MGANLINTPNLPDLEYPTYLNFFYKLVEFSTEVFNIIYPTLNDNDTLLFVCRGSSGSILSTLTANLFHKEGVHVNIHYVKKENETEHDNNTDPVHSSFTKIIIIDDFIVTGYTIEFLKKFILEVYPDHKKCDYLCVGRNKNEHFQNDDFFLNIIYSK